MSQAVFEHVISASERPQTYALDGAATGTDNDRSTITDNKRAATGTGEYICGYLNLIKLFFNLWKDVFLAEYS